MMPLIIEKLYAWISEDDDGQQGVIVWTPPGVMALPLVGADMARMESFRPYIKTIAAQSGKKIFLMEFSTKTVLEVVGAQAGESRDH